MDTQEIGTTIENVNETATSDTSETSQEDADARRIEDKKAYLKELDRQIKEAEANRNKVKKVDEDQDDVMTWLTTNQDDLKLVTKEYNEELAFYKSHKIPVSNEIRDRALASAKSRKGVGKNASTEQVTALGGSTEMRKAATINEIPAAVKAANPKMTLERYKELKAEIEAENLARR